MATGTPETSNTMQREEVVPWSMAAMYRGDPGAEALWGVGVVGVVGVVMATHRAVSHSDTGSALL
jgi:hypothetical protein